MWLIAWIFQISGGLSSAVGVRIILAGGALASNIVWVVSGMSNLWNSHSLCHCCRKTRLIPLTLIGAVTLGGDSHFEGVLLGATSATLITGATMNGRVLVQTAASLQKATVIQPS